MKRLTSILTAIILAVSLLSGCTVGGGGEQASSGTDASSEKYGGVLNLSSYKPDTMNPYATKYSCVRDFLYLIYDELFIVKEDLSAKPVLATDYTVSDQNTVYTINLRHSVTFHNGEDFTADDVIATFEYIQKYANIYKENLANVASYQAKDNYTVVIRLKYPQSNFVNNLDFPILPKGLNAGSFADENEGFVPNGTGRYKYEKTNLYKDIVLTKNDFWMNADKVYIPKVRIRFVKDNESMLYAFNSGETDLITTDRARWGEFACSGEYNTFEVTTSKYVYIGLNTKTSAFSDIDLRLNISNALDKELLNDSIMFSHACDASSPISSKAYFAPKKQSEGNTKKKSLKDKELSFYLLYNSESKMKKEIAEYVKSKLMESGVEVVLSEVDYQTYQSRVMSGNYQAYIGEVDVARDCNLNFMFGISSYFAPSNDGAENIIPPEAVFDEPEEIPENVPEVIKPPSELENLFVSLNIAQNENEMSVACKNIEDYYKTNIPQIPLFHINDALLANARIKGKASKNLTNFYADLGDIYIGK